MPLHRDSSLTAAAPAPRRTPVSSRPALLARRPPPEHGSNNGLALGKAGATGRGTPPGCEGQAASQAGPRDSAASNRPRARGKDGSSSSGGSGGGDGGDGGAAATHAPPLPHGSGRAGAVSRSRHWCVTAQPPASRPRPPAAPPSQPQPPSPPSPAPASLPQVPPCCSACSTPWPTRAASSPT